MIRTVVFLLLTPALALADFAEDFKKTRGIKDHQAMVKLLDAAAKTEADNPDYYALASNYWWSFAGEINLSTKPAAEKAPEDTLVLSNLADAHRDRGHLAEAAKVYRKIIELEPGGEAAAAAKEGLGAVEKKN